MTDERPRTRKPGFLLRLGFRFPVYLYSIGLGWLFGKKFLRLTHEGRRTGRIRHTVLEVVSYDEVKQESVVAAAYGVTSDWYRNIQSSDALEIRTGFRRYAPSQRFLSPDEAYDELTEYEVRHPRTFRSLLRMVSIAYDGSESQRRKIASIVPMVAFRPAILGASNHG